MAELGHSEKGQKEYSVGSLGVFILLYRPLRCSAHELISRQVSVILANVMFRDINNYCKGAVTSLLY